MLACGRSGSVCSQDAGDVPLASAGRRRGAGAAEPSHGHRGTGRRCWARKQCLHRLLCLGWKLGCHSRGGGLQLLGVCPLWAPASADCHRRALGNKRRGCPLSRYAHISTLNKLGITRWVADSTETIALIGDVVRVSDIPMNRPMIQEVEGSTHRSRRRTRHLSYRLPFRSFARALYIIQEAGGRLCAC